MYENNKIPDWAFEGYERLCRILWLCSTPPKVSVSSLPFVWWLIVLENFFHLYKKPIYGRSLNFAFWGKIETFLGSVSYSDIVK